MTFLFSSKNIIPTQFFEFLYLYHPDTLAQRFRGNEHSQSSLTYVLLAEYASLEID